MGFRNASRLVVAALLVYGLTGLVARSMVTEIVISKSRRTLTALRADGARITVPAAFGRSGVGPKLREGDERTPEGRYRVCFKNPRSRFHLSLGLDFPNPEDARTALATGVIPLADYVAILEAHRRGRIPPWTTALGGEIFIHGGGDRTDGTAGCIAVADPAIEALFPLVDLGTPVVIEP
jgi:murein L,D-transpeptidase YafK